MQLQPGTLLHGANYDYRIDATLGQGSFGAIGTNAAVAVKEFFMRDLNSRSGTTVVSTAASTLYGHYRHDFQHEAQNLSRLASQHIVKVLETFEANNTVYFVMEMLDGGSLDTYIRQRGRLSEREALDGIIQVGEAVECMHRAHMLHLDIKPMNVMRRGDGSLVLIDFGLSKQFTSDGQPETSTSIGGGTLGYAPLEQASYKKQDGFMPTLDIYALGATLYKMLTGTVPPDASVVFNDGFPYGALLQVGVSEAVADFVERAMEPMRRKRPQNMAAFIAEARALLPAASAVVKTAATASPSVGGGAAQTNDATVIGEAKPHKAATTPSLHSQNGLVDMYGKPRQLELVSVEPVREGVKFLEKPVTFEVHWASYVDEEEKQRIRLFLQGARTDRECHFVSNETADMSVAYGLDTDNVYPFYQFDSQLSGDNLFRLYQGNDVGSANSKICLWDKLKLVIELEEKTGLPFRIAPPDFLDIYWSAVECYWETLRVAGFDHRGSLTISTYAANNRGQHEWTKADIMECAEIQLIVAGTKPLFNSCGFCVPSTQPVRDEVQPMGLGFYRVRTGDKWEVVAPSAPFSPLVDRKFKRVTALGFYGVPGPGPRRVIFGIMAKDSGMNFYYEFRDGCFNLVTMLTDAQEREMAQWT